MRVKMLQTCFIGKKKYPSGEIVDVSKSETDSMYPLCMPLEMDIQPNKNARKVSFNIASPVIYMHDGYGKINRTMRQNVIGSGNVDIYFTTPHGFALQKPDKNKVNILYTMFEADTLPECWIPLIKNSVDYVVVPSSFCSHVFTKAGIETKLIPLYVDKFYKKTPANKTTFTFGMENAFLVGRQKGWDIVITCFEKLKKKYKSNIELKIKGRESHYQYNLMDWVERARSIEGVKVIIEDYDDEQMKEWYSDIDCFVFPSRGEGFGLPPLQAMSAGIPTILTNAHGMKDFASLGIPIKTNGTCPSHYVNRVNGDTDKCLWVEPDVKRVYEAMEDVWLNYPKYLKRAKTNAKKVNEHYSIGVFIEEINKYAEQLQNS